jgi:hypothetical protein
MRSRDFRVEVPLPPLQAAHVGPVDPDGIGEGFLGQPLGLPVCPQVLPDDLLEISLGHG